MTARYFVPYKLDQIGLGERIFHSHRAFLSEQDALAAGQDEVIAKVKVVSFHRDYNVPYPMFLSSEELDMSQNY